MPSFEHAPATEPTHDPVFEAFLSQELPRQYNACLKTLRDVRLLEPVLKNTSDDIAIELGEGITAMNGMQYELPSSEQIRKHFSAEKYREKISQGFTRLLIVPFGYPLATIRARYEQELLKHHKAGTLLDKDGNKLDLDTSQPLSVWKDLDHTDETGNLIYYPTQFDQQNHGGKTKQELLNDPAQPFPGFHILLIKPDLTIPREGQGKITGTRKDLETNKTSRDYLKTIQTEPPYHQEQGFTLEDQLVLAVTNLNQTNTMIDDYAYEGAKPEDSCNFVIGNYHKTSDFVPSSYWIRLGRLAGVYGSASKKHYENYGARVAVG